MDLGLAGKRALVVGGSRGIGLAVARSLAAEGADVAVAGRTRESLDAAAQLLAAQGGRVLALQVDTTDDASVRAMVDRLLEAWQGVDILVNSAARPAGSPADAAGVADLVDDDLRVEIETKVLGYLRTARAVAPHMVAQGWGRIVNIAGLNARRTGGTFGSMRNVAVVAMTKNLSDELAPQGVNVTVVHPGVTVTERTADLLRDRAERAGVSLAEAEAQAAASVSIGRLVTADEVAAVITFLASPRSVAITGEPIAVGGGTPGTIFY